MGNVPPTVDQRLEVLGASPATFGGCQRGGQGAFHAPCVTGRRLAQLLAGKLRIVSAALRITCRITHPQVVPR